MSDDTAAAPPPRGSDEDEATPVIAALLSAVFQLQLQQRQIVATTQQQTGLSDSDLVALGLLTEQPPAPIKQLADRLQLTPGSTSTLVDRLTRAGMTTRTTSSFDRRVALVAISAQGRAVINAIRQRYVAAAATALHATSPEHLAAATEVVIEIASNLAQPKRPTKAQLQSLPELATVGWLVDAVSAAPLLAVQAHLPDLEQGEDRQRRRPETAGRSGDAARPSGVGLH